MSNIILIENPIARQDLLPLTFTRPIGDMRIGILTIKEKWERWTEAKVSYLTEAYLAVKFPVHITVSNLLINSSVLPNAVIVDAIKKLKKTELLTLANGTPVAYYAENRSERLDFFGGIYDGFDVVTLDTDAIQINFPYDIFKHNGAALEVDFELLTKGRVSQPLSDTNTVMGKENIFVEEGASVECSILNATTGSIYIGKNATIMEGCIIRGGLAMCDHAVLKMGAKIYGATTLGSHCKVGGEVNNAVFFAYSNKGHEGFLGNSVLGEWCNIGADTNTSNLKNNYSEVKLWNYPARRFKPTGLQFCGLIMADHAKAGINTMFNTGTIVGVAANVFGAGYPRNFIPSYTWGGTGKNATFRLKKAYEVAERMMERRKIDLTDTEKSILEYIFNNTAAHRTWEK